MDEEESNFWRNVATALMISIICLFSFGTMIIIGNAKFFKRCSMTTVNCNNLFFYLSVLLSVRKQSRPGVPPLSLIFQALVGMCRLIFRERIACLYVFSKPFVFFYKPETVEVVLSSTTMIDKSKEYQLLSPWLGTGIFLSTGTKWRRSRKLLTPAFHFSILHEFIPAFQEQSSVLVSKLQSLVQEPWVDVVPLMTACTLDIICQTAMGININAQDGQNSEYVRAAHKLEEAFMHRVLRPWLYPDFIFKWTALGRSYDANIRIVKELTRKVIKEKKLDFIMRNKDGVTECLPNGSLSQRKKRKAFLELLLEQHLEDPSFTEEDIGVEVDTFLLGGHDTTGMGISWALYCLGHNPEIQQKVHEELDDIFGDDIDRNIMREDLTQMKYLECVIKESLRLCPVVPFIARQCNEPFRVLDHTVPSGSLCLILICELHLDPESFPEPEKFIPERFLPENGVGRHPYAYIPFSAGPRNCIGQKYAMIEEKVVLASILKVFRVTSLDSRDKVIITPNLTTKNVKPLRLRFESRKI